MIKILKARLSQGMRTKPFPPEESTLPAAFRCAPRLDASRCPDGCRDCAGACPTGAISLGEAPAVDLGRCLFCPVCHDVCPRGAISPSSEFGLSSSARDGLRLGQVKRPEVEALTGGLRRLLGRSLKLRQVSAGGCNGCEAELNALSNVDFDAGRFGIQFVASPRHADGIVVTGPVPHAMSRALIETWEAVPEPKVVILVGACAISGGIFAGSPAVAGFPGDLPVHLAVPGCPPHPFTLLDGFLKLLGRI